MCRLRRRRRARSLGYDRVTAELLARSGADLHALERLLADGCELKLAAQIVL